MNVSKRTLKILAAAVWYIGGIVLLVKGRSLLAEADAIEPERYWRWLAPVIGFAVGGLKGWFLFRKSCDKNLVRIDALTQPRAWQFFRPWFFFFLFLMISAGATMSRLAHGHYGFLIGVAILDISIATALLTSSYMFWKRRAFAMKVA